MHTQEMSLPFPQLPCELNLYVFSFLKLETISLLRRVNGAFKNFIDSSSLQTPITYEELRKRTKRFIEQKKMEGFLSSPPPKQIFMIMLLEKFSEKEHFVNSIPPFEDCRYQHDPVLLLKEFEKFINGRNQALEKAGEFFSSSTVSYEKLEKAQHSLINGFLQLGKKWLARLNLPQYDNWAFLENPTLYKILDTLTERGDPHAFFWQGVRFIEGLDKQEIDKGVTFLQRAATKNVLLAQIEILRLQCLKRGKLKNKILPGKINKALQKDRVGQYWYAFSLHKQGDEGCMKWLDLSIEQGYLPAKSLKGRILLLEQNRDIEIGLSLIKEAASQNFAEAKYVWGKWNKQKSSLIEEAADQGDAEAAFEVAKENYRQSYFYTASKYMKMAADQDYPPAQFLYGKMFEEGKGCEQNLIEATKYYQLAIEEDYPDAMLGMAILYENQEATALPLLRKAVNLGHKESQLYLAKLLINRDINRVEGMHLLRLAAAQGSVEANRLLGQELASHFQDSRNMEQALLFLRTAAEQKDGPSELLLGRLYLEGRGVFKNEKEALKWFLKANHHGVAEAKEYIDELKEQYPDECLAMDFLVLE